MRTASYLFLFVFLLSGVGCVVTAYDPIVDNDQVKQGGSGYVNTDGKAHIKESSQVATLWSDGSDESLFFVDQKPNGDQILSNYTNTSTGTPTFHDDLYCNPDWQGCSTFTAPDPNEPNDNFDGMRNMRCPGARSISILTATSRYYGECGRVRVPLAWRLRLINEGVLGTSELLGNAEALFYDLDPSQVSVILDNTAGDRYNLRLTGDAVAAVAVSNRRAYLDLTDPLLGVIGRDYAHWLDTRATAGTRVEVTYQGMTLSGLIAGNQGESNPKNVLDNVNRHY